MPKPSDITPPRTKPFSDTVFEREKRHPVFRAAMLSEALVALDEGDLDGTKVLLRDLVRYETFAASATVVTESDYDWICGVLDGLSERVRGDEEHPLAPLLHHVGDLIVAYDRKHHPIAEMAGVDLLRSLMEDHGLRQSDLPEVGGEGVVSEILAGRRTIDAQQALALGERFAMNPGAFLR